MVFKLFLSAGDNRQELCNLPPVKPGFFCEALIPKWTFNPITEKCEFYEYGGCGGTANLFQTEKECKAACH